MTLSNTGCVLLKCFIYTVSKSARKQQIILVVTTLEGTPMDSNQIFNREKGQKSGEHLY